MQQKLYMILVVLEWQEHRFKPYFTYSCITCIWTEPKNSLLPHSFIVCLVEIYYTRYKIIFFRLFSRQQNILYPVF